MARVRFYLDKDIVIQYRDYRLNTLLEDDKIDMEMWILDQFFKRSGENIEYLIKEYFNDDFHGCILTLDFENGVISGVEYDDPVGLSGYDDIDEDYYYL